MSRSLPKKNNPLILADVAPACKFHLAARAVSHKVSLIHYLIPTKPCLTCLLLPFVFVDEDLVTRRCLMRTCLSVEPELIGTNNATKPENLGYFEYAYLTSPLPGDLNGSEIHSSSQSSARYFLIRRSKDGFISATSMFKIAFPWAKAREERDERRYLISQRHTSPNHVAGNIWICPTFALELAKEYNMYNWVRALLDPVDIVGRRSPKRHKNITPPPKFELPVDGPSESQRSCSCQSAVSPSKDSTSSCMAPLARSTKDVLSTPSSIVAYENLQKTFGATALMEATRITPLPAEADAVEIEVKASWRGDYHIVNPPIEFAQSQRGEFHIVNAPVEFAHSQRDPNILEVKGIAATAEIWSQGRAPEHQSTG
ncbi:uncharacterized protein N7503_004576 [Penicillium pulvis]|uniref:uncharacterized protein n=1 Tax=Penicillium pulvis TaxID=1562058 RepID=UPI0025472A5A|nr:uncharacterized protein N7503_004576 [Penicillium pulvis]KAJ5802126.1 hypothetical protein N7503_004576 [Penicillium pulvis]